MSKITEFLPSFAGLQLNTEINALKKVTTEIKKPVTCVIGGSKISTKIGIIKNLIPKFDNIVIVGGMANNILHFKGNKIGKSIKEENCEGIINEIFETSKIIRVIFYIHRMFWLEKIQMMFRVLKRLVKF